MLVLTQILALEAGVIMNGLSSLSSKMLEGLPKVPKFIANGGIRPRTSCQKTFQEIFLRFLRSACVEASLPPRLHPSRYQTRSRASAASSLTREMMDLQQTILSDTMTVQSLATAIFGAVCLMAKHLPKMPTYLIGFADLCLRSC
jgi:hypothetical protein